MSLSKKVKVGFDETRILILGSQILLGFQFQGAFRPVFERLPFHDRVVWVAALGLITLTIALLITPSVQHRMVEGGRDTKRLLGVIGRHAGLALAPFALALGADLYLAVRPVLGFAPGVAAGLLFGGLALLFWYGLEALKARTVGERERTMTSREPEQEHTSLETKIEQMLTEARVVLPGAQALLGFQLVITFSEAFEKLSPAAKVVHLVALGFLALTVIWLMAPAAFHRIVYAGEETPEFHALGSRFLLAASATLALGISADLGVVTAKALASERAGVTGGSHPSPSSSACGTFIRRCCDGGAAPPPKLHHQSASPASQPFAATGPSQGAAHARRPASDRCLRGSVPAARVQGACENRHGSLAPGVRARRTAPEPGEEGDVAWRADDRSRQCPHRAASRKSISTR